MSIRAVSMMYGPLSIEEAQREDLNVFGSEDSTSRLPSCVGRCYRPSRCSKRRCYIISLALICMVISALIVAKRMFHLSVSNLIGTLVGGGKQTPANIALCLPADEASTYNMNQTSVERLVLDKLAPAFFQSLTAGVDGREIISSGFLWNEEDAETTKWRPQGVTTFHLHGRRYVLVSWYGRKDEGYSDRGGRISIVGIPESLGRNESHQDEAMAPREYLYTHVLLVDENFCTLPNIHVGGIEQRNGTLYVADSRKGRQSILEFDIHNGLFELHSHMAESMFGYRYVLRQSASFPSPIKPSFISFDIDANKFVVGTYARCGNKIGIHEDSEKCFRERKNSLVWFSESDLEMNRTVSCWHYFSEMQGAASARVDDSRVIWVSSSYGPIAKSHLHVITAPASFTGQCPGIEANLEQVFILDFPPGLEDLHIEESKGGRGMWSLTEFGTRKVFVTPIQHLLNGYFRHDS